MAIYRVGQELELSISIRMRILRAFAIDDSVYYIVWIPKNERIQSTGEDPLYGVFRHDNTNGPIPVEANQLAKNIIDKENLLQGLE